jgi:hypothetical protein
MSGKINNKIYDKEQCYLVKKVEPRTYHSEEERLQLMQRIEQTEEGEIIREIHKPDKKLIVFQYLSPVVPKPRAKPMAKR